MPTSRRPRPWPGTRPPAACPPRCRRPSSAKWCSWPDGRACCSAVRPDLGALLPAVVLFWKDTEPRARRTEQTAFLKDVSRGGAALMLLAFFSLTGDELGLTVTGPLFGTG